MKCDIENCTNAPTLRYPVKIRGEYVFLCYGCYMKYLEGKNAEIPMSYN